ncbi:hypothetical protein HK101_006800 [Irineochytrium annulatum]|nr:hypothetical protein HK101_006800 [Irineochytrium annulatum]
MFNRQPPQRTAPTPIYDPASQHVYTPAPRPPAQLHHAPLFQQHQHVYRPAPPPVFPTYSTASPPELAYDNRGSHVTVLAQLPPAAISPMAPQPMAPGPEGDPEEFCVECRTRFGKGVSVRKSSAFAHHQRFHMTELGVTFASGEHVILNRDHGCCFVCLCGKELEYPQNMLKHARDCYGGRTSRPLASSVAQSPLPAAYQASVPPAPAEQPQKPPEQVVIALDDDEELCEKCRVYLFRPGVVIRRKDKSEHNRKMHRLSITVRYPDGVARKQLYEYARGNRGLAELIHEAIINDTVQPGESPGDTFQNANNATSGDVTPGNVTTGNGTPENGTPSENVTPGNGASANSAGASADATPTAVAKPKTSRKRKNTSTEDLSQLGTAVEGSPSEISRPARKALVDESGDVVVGAEADFTPSDGQMLCEDCRDFLKKTVYITKKTRQGHRKRIHQLNCWVIYQNGVEEYLERFHGNPFTCFCGHTGYYVQSMQTHCRMCRPPDGYVPKVPDPSMLEKKGREKDDDQPKKRRRLAGLDLKKLSKKRNGSIVTDADRQDVLEQWFRLAHSALDKVEHDLILPAARVEELIFEIAKDKKEEYHVLAKYHLDLVMTLLRERPNPATIRVRLLEEPLLPAGIGSGPKGAVRQLSWIVGGGSGGDGAAGLDVIVDA